MDKNINKEEIYRKFINSPNRNKLTVINGVTGLGIRYKSINNVTVEPKILCLAIYVVKKKPIQELGADEIIPKYYLFDGIQIPTDIIETGGYPVASNKEEE